MHRIGARLQAPGAACHVSRLCGSAAPRRDEKRFFLGGRSPPKPSHRVGGVGKPGFPLPLRAGCALTFPGGGRGETRFPPTPACGPGPPAGGAWGNPVSPYPCVRAAPPPSRGRGCGAIRFPPTPARGLCPPKPSRRVREWGNPVAPSPCVRAWPVPTLLRAGCGATPLPHTPAPEDDVQPSKCSGDLVAQRRRGVQAAAPGARAPRFVEHQH